MIFSSRNENNEPAWLLVQNGRKTVTRRLKPKKIDSILWVQPNRGKKGICLIRILRCDKEIGLCQGFHINKRDEEAKKEGFETFVGLEKWFMQKYHTTLLELYRIEFERC